MKMKIVKNMEIKNGHLHECKYRIIDTYMHITLR
jgi:hypothetical protein